MWYINFYLCKAKLVVWAWYLRPNNALHFFIFFLILICFGFLNNIPMHFEEYSLPHRIVHTTRLLVTTALCFVILFRWDLTHSEHIKSKPKWVFLSFNPIHVLKTKTRFSPYFLCFAEMKRMRDDIFSAAAPAPAPAPQFKRPLTSTRGES